MIRNATFSITNRCNSRCKICNIWKTTDFSDELSLSQIKELFSKPYFQDLDTISITGGEPFLRKDLTEIIKLAKNILPKLKRIFLNTNATIIEPVLDVCKLCTSLFSETILSISLDGTETVHNSLRGINNYKNVLLLIDRASSIKGLKVSLSMTISKGNCSYDELQHVHKLAQKYNTMFSFRFADMSKTYYKNEDIDLSLSEEKKHIVSKYISENGLDNEFLAVLKEYIETKKVPFIVDENGCNHCLAGKEFIFIHPNGSVSPCLYSSQKINIDSKPPQEVELGKFERCPCCTDCAIYPILEYKKNLEKEQKC